jgi:hypothetical protein
LTGGGTGGINLRIIAIQKVCNGRAVGTWSY